MRAEHDRDAIGDLIERFDEDGAHRLQRVNDIAVVHDLVPDIDRRTIFPQREFDDADRAIDASAETARRRDQNLEFRRFAALRRGRRVGSVPNARALAQQVPWGKAASTFLSRLRREEHTSELQSLMRISYAVFCLKKKDTDTHHI